MPSTRISTVSALTGVLLLIAGCGGSSSDSSAKSSSGNTAATSSVGTTTVPSSTPAASPSPTVTPATVAQLRKVVLRATDLPRGWKAAPAEVNDDDNAGQAELMRCLGARNTDEEQVAIAHSADYTLGDAVLSSSATSYMSQSALDSDLAVLKSPKLTPCFGKLLTKVLTKSLPEGASLGTVSVKFTPGPGTGPENVAGSGLATVPLTVNGQQVKVYVSFVYLTGPLMEVEIDAENVGSPVPAAVLESAIKAVAARAAAGG